MNPVTKRLLAAHADEEDDVDAAILSCVSHLLLACRPPPRKKKRGGSRPGKAANINRDDAGGHQRLWRDYFMSDPVYTAKLFRRRFRMSRRLFDKVLDSVVRNDRYFVQRPDATGKLGLSSHQKVTAALRMFCYGAAADSLDEYLRISETVASDCPRHFSDAVIDCFGDEFLRQPTAADTHRHTNINKARGFPGIFGSLDCTHWEWKNCPYGLKGQYQDRDGKCSLVMEAVATYDLWIWHAFIGLPDSNNDLNILLSTG